MSYLSLATSGTIADLLAANQGTSNIDVLIAAAAGVIGAITGAVVTVIGARISTGAENLRQERQLASDTLKLREAYRQELERQVRETAVGLSDAWAGVIKATDRYRGTITGLQNEADEARIHMVEALTLFGSKLNALLVLPISETLESQVFAIESAVDSLRLSINDPKEAVRYRDAVSPTIHKLFRTLREGDVLRVSIPGTEVK
jgi:hypothetical protein